MCRSYINPAILICFGNFGALNRSSHRAFGGSPWWTMTSPKDAGNTIVLYGPGIGNFLRKAKINRRTIVKLELLFCRHLGHFWVLRPEPLGYSESLSKPFQRLCKGLLKGFQKAKTW